MREIARPKEGFLGYGKLEAVCNLKEGANKKGRFKIRKKKGWVKKSKDRGKGLTLSTFQVLDTFPKIIY